MVDIDPSSMNNRSSHRDAVGSGCRRPGRLVVGVPDEECYERVEASVVAMDDLDADELDR